MGLDAEFAADVRLFLIIMHGSVVFLLVPNRIQGQRITSRQEYGDQGPDLLREDEGRWVPLAPQGVIFKANTAHTSKRRYHYVVLSIAELQDVLVREGRRASRT